MIIRTSFRTLGAICFTAGIILCHLFVGGLGWPTFALSSIVWAYRIWMGIVEPMPKDWRDHVLIWPR